MCGRELTERDVKKTVGVSKAMTGEERFGNERRDTPTTSISHERRGSALAAERAGRDEGRGGGRRRRRVESGGSEGGRRTLAAAELHQGPFYR